MRIFEFNIQESSPFRRKRSIKRTIGFEFEVEVELLKQTAMDDIIYNIKMHYPIEEFWDEKYSSVSQEIDELISGLDLVPGYGWVPLIDIAENFENEQPVMYKLKEQLPTPEEFNATSPDDKFDYMVNLAFLSNFSKEEINEVSSFNDLKAKNPDFLDRAEYATEKRFDDIDKIYKMYYNKLPYTKKDVDEDELSDEYVYNENGEMINIYDELNYQSFAKLFNDSEEITNFIEEQYEQVIDEIAENEYRENEQEFDEVDYGEIQHELKSEGLEGYTVVKDGSLEYGFEAISPVYENIEVGIRNMKKMLRYIRKESGLYTTKNTGLHINIGTWDNFTDIDLLKLLVFSGEGKVLKQFSRQNNTFTKALLPDMIEYLKGMDVKNPNETIRSINDKLLAQDHNMFIDFGKLAKYGYIEIRGIGNENYEYREDEIEKIIRHVVKVLAVAENPETAKKQYLNKLIKLSNDITSVDGQEKKDKGKKEEKSSGILTDQEINTLIKFLPNEKREIQEIGSKQYIEVINDKHVLSLVYDFIVNVALHASDNSLTNQALKVIYKLSKILEETFGEEHLRELYDERIQSSNSVKLKNLFQKYILK